MTMTMTMVVCVCVCARVCVCVALRCVFFSGLLRHAVVRATSEWFDT